MTIFDAEFGCQFTTWYELYPSSKLKEQISQKPGNGGSWDSMSSKLFTLQIQDLKPFNNIAKFENGEQFGKMMSFSLAF